MVKSCYKYGQSCQKLVWSHANIMQYRLVQICVRPLQAFGGFLTAKSVKKATSRTFESVRAAVPSQRSISHMNDLLEQL